jgi:hypothetical protein
LKFAALEEAKLNAPKHLQRSRLLWRDVAERHELEPWHVERLLRACEDADRADEAAPVLPKEGLTLIDKGAVKAHPCVAAELQNRAAEARLLGQLRLGEGEVASSTRRGAAALARKRWAK